MKPYSGEYFKELDNLRSTTKTARRVGKEEIDEEL